MGRRVRIRGAKATPKTLEREFLEKSKALAEDPYILMPKCTRDCRKCAIKKALKKVEAVSNKRDNERKLAAAALRGDPIVRAYAATISLSMDGKIPFLATAKTPMGEISYAMRGNADRDLLIGMQHYDDPQFRLMAFWKVADKYDLHIYSYEDNLICCPDGPEVPKGYVRDMVDSLPYELADDYSCPHSEGEHLQVSWNSANLTIRVCSSCAKEGNTLHALVSQIAAKNPTDDFSISVDRGIKCFSECSDCPIKGNFSPNPETLSKYLTGQLSDAEFLDASRIDWAKNLQDLGKELYLISGSCFGSDKEKFLESLRGTESEKEVLKNFMLSGKRCIISRNDQIANLLSDLWKDHAEELLSAIASPETVSHILKERMDLAPSQMVAEAVRMENYTKIKSKLPTFLNLGPTASFCDMVARTYKTEGKTSAVRVLEKSKGTNHNMRSLTYALLSAVGEGQSKSWQFTREEMDFGTYLAPFAKTLLVSEGNEYAKSLNLLLEAAGAMEKVSIQQ